MKPFRIAAILVLTALLFSSASIIAAPSMKEPLRFAIIGDRTGGHVPGVYPSILDEIEQLKPDFVMTVGDMIEGYTEDEEQLRKEWEEYMGLWKNLSMPIHHTPGNHDITNEVMLPFYQENLGDPVYSFTEKNVHFVILDNSRYNTPDEMPEEQLTWLQKDLKKHAKKAMYTIVFIHQPFWYNTIGRGEPDKLHDIFLTNGVDAVFTGHYHRYFSGEFDGIIYTSIGSSGGATRVGPTGIEYHYAWVTIDNNGIHIANLHKDSVFPWDEVTVHDLHVIEDIYATAVDLEEKLYADDNLKVPMSELIITVSNPSSELAMKDTLVWDIPRGWTVSPKRKILDIAPGESEVLKFRAMCSGVYSPSPSFVLDFPYRGERTFPMDAYIPVGRKVVCRKVDTAPVIDGEIMDAIWTEPVTRFFAPDGGQVTTDQTHFFFAHDAENLYLAAFCADKDMGSLVANVAEHDGLLFGEDCVGYFFVPSMEGGANYQVYFNPNGAAFDQKISFEGDNLTAVERDWNGEYEVAVHKGDDFWSIEARVPLATIGAEATEGAEWLVNFRRKQKRLDTTADWMTPISYEPRTYGVMVIE